MDISFDCHSHIIAELDDGCSSQEEFIKMLDSYKENGIETIISTSHFYFGRNSVDVFLKKRNEFLNNNEKIIFEYGLNIIPASEVLLYEGMENNECLKDLCIGNSKHILIEMPYIRWTTVQKRTLCNVKNYNGLIPVLAHIERYLRFFSYKEICNLIDEFDCPIQINASFIKNFTSRRLFNYLIKKQRQFVIGSDTHGNDDGIEMISKATKYIKKKYGEDLLKKINFNSKYITECN